MVGQTLGHYRIREKLGAGGMGEVFLADDLNLDRQVALKIIPPQLSQNHERLERFQREAKTLAALDHPNIVTIYSVEEEEGVRFITMQLVEGSRLSDLIQDGGMDLAKFLGIAIPLASALASAHDKGVTHRDIKPGNIMVTGDDQPMILDFGLAKLRPDLESPQGSQASTEPLTEPGRIVGTVNYMSPEQVRNQPLDQRSDIFSLGIVFYEMVTGKRPFDGHSTMEIASAILHEEPRSVTEFNAQCPSPLNRVISRCLRKDPADRYQSTVDLFNDLRDVRAEMSSATESLLAHRSDDSARRRVPAGIWLAIAAIAALVLTALVFSTRSGLDRQVDDAPEQSSRASVTDGSSPLRVAVLRPLVYSQGSEADDWPALIQAFLGSGLTGSSSLAVVDPLSLTGVIKNSLGSSTPERTPELYQLLNDMKIDILIDGGILKESNQYQLMTNLIDMGTREVRFSHLEDASSLDDLFGATESALGQIAAFLQIELLGLAADEDLAPWISNYPKNPAAVRELIAAYEYIMQGLPGGEPHLRNAITIDPEFVAPRVWLVASLVQQERVEEAQQQLQALQDLGARSNPFESALVSWTEAFVGHDLPTQARHLRVALSYSPGNLILLFNLAIVLAGLDDCEGAIEAMRPAVEVQYRYPHLYPLWGWCNIRLGQPEEAQAGLLGAIDLPAVEPKTYGLLEALAILDGDSDSAENFGKLHTRARLESGQPEQDVDLVPVYLYLANYCAEAGNLSCAEALNARAQIDNPVE